jgi:isocitrate dehydrogenase
MGKNDFRSNEVSVTMSKNDNVSIQHINKNGETSVLKENLALQEGEIIDATKLSVKSLVTFLNEQVKDAKDKGVLFSLHMKATMMKVSDPIIFGHAVKAFFKPVFEKYSDVFVEIGVEENNGFGNVLSKIEELPADKKAEIECEINKCLEEGPALAMVNSDKGITNLHVPSDVIIDASMPAMIRTSGQMWNAEGKQQDTKAVIPDSCYASVYQATIDFCRENGAFDPTTMGTVPNVGLMAQKAEEYGSHDKTFEIQADGKVQVLDSNGAILIEHTVEKGDIWRMCQTKDAPVQDWIKLAVKRAKATNTPAIFWLDSERAHDAEIIKKIEKYLPESDTSNLDIRILPPYEATQLTLKRIKSGLDTISVTGNVLRDYLTDLFPILEVGTSAKMLSIVPLMNGGGLFETGAGGSAPKHVQQFVKENHLRWDSLGEFLALAVSLEHLAETYKNSKALILAETLDEATDKFLENKKSPSRKVNELDNRGSHFYLALYWAEALANQTNDMDLKAVFTKFYNELLENKAQILEELNTVQGKGVDLKGYYKPDFNATNTAMRPSKTLNEIIASITANSVLA